jgi:hypothetical protein
MLRRFASTDFPPKSEQKQNARLVVFVDPRDRHRHRDHLAGSTNGQRGPLPPGAPLTFAALVALAVGLDGFDRFRLTTICAAGGF